MTVFGYHCGKRNFQSYIVCMAVSRATNRHEWNVPSRRSGWELILTLNSAGRRERIIPIVNIYGVAQQ